MDRDSWAVWAVAWKNAQTSLGGALNTALRSAMESAGLSPRQLALRVGVSGKTVERWVSDSELIPHARNREDACKALGVDEEMIWPKAVKERIKTGGDREILHSYPYRSACPSTVWAELTEKATGELFFAGYTNYFLWTQLPDFLGTIRRKAQEGCRVRFLIGDPNGEVTSQRETIEDVALTVSTRIRITLENVEKLREVEGIETRFSSPEDAVNHVSLSVFRFDNEALVTPHLARLVGHDSPLLHLRRIGDGGMFSHFSDHAEELWSRGVPVGQ
ncbi:helix-turn-helix domain-containing protein [Streptomyces europaeiscabiei]|uniref:helix-turn-helix domain-containing protein n=1 Tax=Streptomyces europaeiscabiei TaxID=146819 RepID=UPI0029C0DB10|nr:helix-turn-helix domain-containing protein [Streptomyces europaeiscabiei]